MCNRSSCKWLGVDAASTNPKPVPRVGMPVEAPGLQGRGIRGFTTRRRCDLNMINCNERLLASDWRDRPPDLAVVNAPCPAELRPRCSTRSSRLNTLSGNMFSLHGVQLQPFAGGWYVTRLTTVVVQLHGFDMVSAAQCATVCPATTDQCHCLFLRQQDLLHTFIGIALNPLEIAARHMHLPCRLLSAICTGSIMLGLNSQAAAAVAARMYTLCTL